MSGLPDIATLWVGTSLSWLERLTLHSFVQRGHKITLFHTDPIDSVDVEGVELADAREVFDHTSDFRDAVGAAFLSDVFRLHLAASTDLIWVDTDALCYRPFFVQDGYLMAWSPFRGQIPNGVLALPRSSAAVEVLMGYIDGSAGIPPWLKTREQKALKDVAAADRLKEIAQFARISFGPPALTWALQETGEIERALPSSTLYPYPWYLADAAFNPHGGVTDGITDKTISVHLYTSQIRRWNKNRPVIEGSFIDRFMQDVGFDYGPRRMLAEMD